MARLREGPHGLRELIRRGLIAPGDVDERSIKDVRPEDVAGYAQVHLFAGIGGSRCEEGLNRKENMPKQIIQQPDGQFAIYSSVVDAFVCIDCTERDLIREFVRDEWKKIADHVRRKVEALKNGEKPYAQFTMSFAEAASNHFDTAADEEDDQACIRIKELLAMEKGAEDERIV